MTSVPPSPDPNQHQHQNTYIHFHHLHAITLSHRHKKPRSGSPSQCSQRDIVNIHPRRNSSCSDATINQPQHTYIHHHHPHTTTPSHRNNKPKSGSPNWRGQCDIASWDPRCDNSGSGASIQDMHNSSGSDDNRHYRKGRFCRSHSSRKRRHFWSHNSRQPDNMHDEETVEAGWSVEKRKLTPSSGSAWQIIKQWICYTLSALSTLCWYRLIGYQWLYARHYDQV